MWAGVAEETVGRLPEGIDGLKRYHIENYHDIDALQRWKKMEKNCPTGWKDHGRTKWKKIVQRDGKIMGVRVTLIAAAALNAPGNAVLLRHNKV